MPDSPTKILIVDDEPLKRSIMEDQLSAAGYAVATASNPLDAEKHLSHAQFQVVITDLRMPGQDGLSFLRELRRREPDQAVIVMTAYGTVETAVEAMKLGAFDYLQKPFSTEELLLKLDKLSRYEHLADENEALRRQLAVQTEGLQIVGRSEGIRKVLARIHAIADADTTVLIEGESGTGKELAARTIHGSSFRATAPFVAVSCAALPRDIIEAELFGHEAGAFTGAVKRRIGRIELAHGGTLFLDDVDDIPMEVQVKLLRVLQERAFERLGSTQPIRVNLRVLAATKQPLSKMVAAGTFREDLYYRLSVVPLPMPPLREHLDDIPLLAEHFLKQIAIKLNRDRLSISSAALGKLRSYSWPGNARQLEHLLEQMVAISSKSHFDEQDIPEIVSGEQQGTSIVSVALDGVENANLAGVLADVEERMVTWALRRAEGNLAKAAEMLGMPRSTLQYKLGKVDPSKGR